MAVNPFMSSTRRMPPMGYEGYQGVGAAPQQAAPIQSVAEILSAGQPSLRPDIATGQADAQRARRIADMLAEGAMQQDNTSIAGGLSSLGQALLARRADKKADESESKYQAMTQRLLQAATGGDAEARSMIESHLMGAGQALASMDSRNRQQVEDGRYIDERDYGRSRDAVVDQRYVDERDYGRGRDSVGDERYIDERDYGRSRDAVGDSQWERNFRLSQESASSDGQGGYGLNVVWGMDDSGNYVPMQAAKGGGLSAAKMPDGVTPLGPYGTAFDTAQGRDEAKRAAMEGPAGQALQGFQTKAGELSELIDKAIDQADFFNTGMTSFGVWSPDFNATLDSIGSRAFLSELISVKSQGATFGALSDAEGRALRDAALNIKKSQSRGQLVENLQRYKAQLQSSAANLQRAFEDDYVNNRAQRRPPAAGGSGGATTVQTATNPQTGEKLELQNGQWVPVQ